MELYYIDVSTCPFNRVYTPIQFIIRIKNNLREEFRETRINNFKPIIIIASLEIFRDFALRQFALDAMLNSFLPIDRSATARAKFKLNENLSFLRISFFSPKIRTFRIKYKQTNSSLEATQFLSNPFACSNNSCLSRVREEGEDKKEGNK